MRRNKFGDYLVDLRKATQKGISEMRTMSGQSGDKDLRMYEQLKPPDFARLANTLGTKTVLGYIRDMELRRLRGEEK